MSRPSHPCPVPREELGAAAWSNAEGTLRLSVELAVDGAVTVQCHLSDELLIPGSSVTQPRGE